MDDLLDHGNLGLDENWCRSEDTTKPDDIGLDLLECHMRDSRISASVTR
jgi:hypothetical protein